MTTTDDVALLVTDTDHDDLDDEVVTAAKGRVLDAAGIAVGTIGTGPAEILGKTVEGVERAGDPTASIWGSKTTAWLRRSASGSTPIGSGTTCSPLSRSRTRVTGRSRPTRRCSTVDGITRHTLTSRLRPPRATCSSSIGRRSAALSVSWTSHNALRITRTGEIPVWKGMTAGNAARNAVYATILARNSMTGPQDVFRSRQGSMEVVSSEFELAFTDCRGVLEGMTKKYIAGTVAQTVLEGMEELMTRQDLDARDIDHV